jgi:hypothetical protein
MEIKETRVIFIIQENAHGRNPIWLTPLKTKVREPTLKSEEVRKRDAPLEPICLAGSCPAPGWGLTDRSWFRTALVPCFINFTRIGSFFVIFAKNRVRWVCSLYLLETRRSAKECEGNPHTAGAFWFLLLTPGPRFVYSIILFLSDWISPSDGGRLGFRFYYIRLLTYHFFFTPPFLYNFSPPCCGI